MSFEFQFNLKATSDNVIVGKNGPRIISNLNEFSLRNNANTAFTNLNLNRILAENGTAFLPSYSFLSSLNSGIYLSGTNQISISINSNNILQINDINNDSSVAILGNRSLILPTGTTGQRPASPTIGMVRYNISISDLEFYNGTNWIALSTVVAGGFNDGTAASPSGYFVLDTDTGFFRPGTNQFGITAGGVLAAIFNQGNITSDSVLVLNGNTSITLPVGTTGQRPTTPVVGMFRYNSTLNQLEFRDGSNWNTVVSTSNISTIINNNASNLTIGFADGTAASPSGYFTADTDTGFFRPGTNQFGITAGGVLSTTFNAGNTTSTSVVAINGNTSITLPVGTTGQRPTTPVVGMFRYNSSISDLEFYNGSTWIPVSTSISGGFADGTAASPSGYFTADTDTGFFRPGTNQFGITAGGVLSAIFNTGNITSTSVLSINGNTSITLPVGTTGQRPTTPVVGMFRYNSSISDLEFYNGSTWIPVSTSVSGGFTDGTATAPSGYFTLDTDTGFFRPGTNQFGITAGGVLSATFNQGNTTTDSVLVLNGNTSVTIPVGTTGQRPTTPVVGMFRYNSSISDLEFYNGSTWIPVSTSISGGFADGTAASPSGYFTADTDTGFFRPGTNQFGITAGGVLS
ncbi:MAG: hypothetical protein NZZ41_05600, partial [Candidatus Dojkabacteria bacterium]|nr:hypothetical protein [Candidatus Dojkabacteria bacterium]